MHFNKGPSYFHNKINDIHNIIDQYKPNVFSISEANYIIDRDNTECGLFDSYNIETTDQLCNFNISRQLLLIDARLQYTRRYDLESRYDCCIWVELKLRGQKSILVQGGYRQWQIPREHDKDQTSKNIKSQFHDA